MLKPLMLAVVASLVLAGPVHAQPASESVVPKFSQAIPNIPGKSVTVVKVTFPPGHKSRAHHHAGSAFIYGYVLSGAIRTQVEGGPVQTLKAGDSFSELPGAHHILAKMSARPNLPASLRSLSSTPRTRS